MLKAIVVSYFRSKRNFAKVLGISPQAVGQWRDVIPEKSALLIEKITNGSLKYSPELYRKYHTENSQHNNTD
ncbi:hypothetical protein ARAF_0824 [Arsenophonus endosymbiont of Aleurodicus floccissimus]|uniref:Cro/CI family transcriptional regulator n=1 Tax=Arsenophonus endosymbiont of Aleurodicus floccissimus TaxID=2152761 RepID=UPI000E6AFC06|nr:Cro/CI family transcriptional regulator [Arsenophonus endosymbiont of Aleurodicus floccissimus]SPP31682.1 hypothetical protein ARAF_0824 [Arsenophonus endosymbiont of Aleurodicus floccissimus]